MATLSTYLPTFGQYWSFGQAVRGTGVHQTSITGLCIGFPNDIAWSCSPYLHYLHRNSIPAPATASQLPDNCEQRSSSLTLFNPDNLQSPCIKEFLQKVQDDTQALSSGFSFHLNGDNAHNYKYTSGLVTKLVGTHNTSGLPVVVICSTVIARQCNGSQDKVWLPSGPLPQNHTTAQMQCGSALVDHTVLHNPCLATVLSSLHLALPFYGKIWVSSMTVPLGALGFPAYATAVCMGSLSGLSAKCGTLDLQVFTTTDVPSQCSNTSHHPRDEAMLNSLPCWTTLKNSILGFNPAGAQFAVRESSTLVTIGNAYLASPKIGSPVQVIICVDSYYKLAHACHPKLYYLGAEWLVEGINDTHLLQRCAMRGGGSTGGGRSADLISFSQQLPLCTRHFLAAVLKHTGTTGKLAMRARDASGAISTFYTDGLSLSRQKPATKSLHVLLCSTVIPFAVCKAGKHTASLVSGDLQAGRDAGQRLCSAGTTVNDTLAGLNTCRDQLATQLNALFATLGQYWKQSSVTSVSGRGIPALATSICVKSISDILVRCPTFIVRVTTVNESDTCPDQLQPTTAILTDTCFATVYDSLFQVYGFDAVQFALSDSATPHTVRTTPDKKQARSSAVHRVRVCVDSISKLHACKPYLFFVARQWGVRHMNVDQAAKECPRTQANSTLPNVVFQDCLNGFLDGVRRSIGNGSILFLGYLNGIPSLHKLAKKSSVAVTTLPRSILICSVNNPHVTCGASAAAWIPDGSLPMSRAAGNSACGAFLTSSHADATACRMRLSNSLHSLFPAFGAYWSEISIATHEDKGELSHATALCAGTLHLVTASCATYKVRVVRSSDPANGCTREHYPKRAMLSDLCFRSLLATLSAFFVSGAEFHFESSVTAENISSLLAEKAAGPLPGTPQQLILCVANIPVSNGTMPSVTMSKITTSQSSVTAPKKAAVTTISDQPTSTEVKADDGQQQRVNSFEPIVRHTTGSPIEVPGTTHDQSSLTDARGDGEQPEANAHDPNYLNNNGRGSEHVSTSGVWYYIVAALAVLNILAGGLLLLQRRGFSICILSKVIGQCMHSDRNTSNSSPTMDNLPSRRDFGNVGYRAKSVTESMVDSLDLPASSRTTELLECPVELPELEASDDDGLYMTGDQMMSPKSINRKHHRASMSSKGSKQRKSQRNTGPANKATSLAHAADAPNNGSTPPTGKKRKKRANSSDVGIVCVPPVSYHFEHNDEVYCDLQVRTPPPPAAIQSMAGGNSLIPPCSVSGYSSESGDDCSVYSACISITCDESDANSQPYHNNAKQYDASLMYSEGISNHMISSEENGYDNRNLHRTYSAASRESPYQRLPSRSSVGASQCPSHASIAQGEEESWYFAPDTLQAGLLADSHAAATGAVGFGGQVTAHDQRRNTMRESIDLSDIVLPHQDMPAMQQDESEYQTYSPRTSIDVSGIVMPQQSQPPHNHHQQQQHPKALSVTSGAPLGDVDRNLPSLLSQEDAVYMDPAILAQDATPQSQTRPSHAHTPSRAASRHGPSVTGCSPYDNNTLPATPQKQLPSLPRVPGDEAQLPQLPA
eukprot:scpid17912/ scgid28420/ 